MKRIFFIAISIMLLCSSFAFAKSVTTTGYGVTATDAENDALRNAVENTVGVLVDSNTLVENNMLIQNQIYTQSRGFITNYTIRSRQQNSDGMWEVTIDALVDDNPNSKLMSELTRLGIINNRLRNPKIAVYVPDLSGLSNSAGETTIVKALIEAGFNNVTEVGSRMNISNPMNMNANQMHQAAQQFGVDIIIVGETHSEHLGDAAKWLPGHQISNMQTCRARLEAKMYVVRTGQIIAADGKYGSGLDNSGVVASRKAIVSAGKQMGEYLIEQLMNLGSSNRQSMQIIAIGSDFSKINMVQSALGKIHGVNNVQLSSYENGKATFTLNYGGSPQNLFNEIQAVTDADLTLQSLTYNMLTIYVR